MFDAIVNGIDACIGAIWSVICGAFAILYVIGALILTFATVIVSVLMGIFIAFFPFILGLAIIITILCLIF